MPSETGGYCKSLQCIQRSPNELGPECEMRDDGSIPFSTWQRNASNADSLPIPRPVHSSRPTGAGQQVDIDDADSASDDAAR